MTVFLKRWLEETDLANLSNLESYHLSSPEGRQVSIMGSIKLLTLLKIPMPTPTLRASFQAFGVVV